MSNPTLIWKHAQILNSASFAIEDFQQMLSSKNSIVQQKVLSSPSVGSMYSGVRNVFVYDYPKQAYRLPKPITTQIVKDPIMLSK